MTSVRLDDAQWHAIVRHLPDNIGTRARNNDQAYRTFVEAVLWVVGNDIVWGDLPPSYGTWRTVYVRFLRWSDQDLWGIVATAIGPDTRLARALVARVEQRRVVMNRRKARKQEAT